MYKKTITYEDYNGEKRTEDFYFDLTKTEAMKLNLGIVGGLEAYMNRCLQRMDVPAILDLFEKVVLKAYGEKTADGRRFEKSEKLSIEFTQTRAYDELFQEIFNNPEKATEFMEGILPADAVAAAKAQQASLEANN